MIRRTVSSAVVAGAVSVLVFVCPGTLIFAQDFPPPADQQQAPPAQTLSPDQLDDLVAPIALYPDSILSQVLVASTYPLELVEANQWLAQNGGLQGQARMDAVREQNWDPSVQALVAFPDVVKRLTQDVRWTTDLGNGFLGQEADVMNAVQRMRQRAQEAGKLTSTAQQTVNVDSQGGEPVIQIQPADPQVVYVPTYDPAYIWGPPVYGYYPPLYYPSFGLGFGDGIFIGSFFGGWGGGWAGWGWGPRWHDHTVIVNNNFFHRYRFNDFHDGRFANGSSVWEHDSGHRLGVPYPNRDLNDRFRGNFQGQRGNFAGGQQSFGGNQQGFRGAPRSEAPQMRNQAPQSQAPAQRFGTPQFEQRNPGGNRSAFGPVQNGGRTRMESDHGFSSMGQQRGAPAFRSAPAPHFSAPSGGGARGGGGGRR
ncbi:MAG: hypothetical protein JWO80_109 [Bryobacterales bacterium]|nr:hypothetical protein [Bryobacterales bacterium]